MTALNEPKVVRWLRTASRASAWVVLGAGLVVLSTWLFSWRTTAHACPLFVAMTPATAAGFVLSASGLLLVVPQWPSRQRYAWAKALSVAIITVGGVAIIQLATGSPLKMDAFVLRETQLLATQTDARMSLFAAGSFVLLGCSLFVFDTHVRGTRPAEWLALLIGLVSTTSLVGYAYETREFSYLLGLSPTLPQTMLAFLALSAGVLCARPEHGIMAPLVSNSPGGQLARRLLPMAVLVPLVLGWVLRNNLEVGRFGPKMAVALFAVSSMACFAALVWWNAGALARADVGRRKAEAAVYDSEESLSITLNSIGDAVIATDAAGRVTRMNPVAERLTGWSLRDAQGRDLDEVFSICDESTKEPVESPVSRVLREGFVVGFANHTELIAQDGTRYPIADSGAPIRDARNNVRGAVLVFRDMTGERKTEAELRTIEAQLRQAQKMEAVGRLAGGIAHDFNNLLSVVLSYSVLLSDEFEKTQDPRGAAIAEIRKAGERATQLTQQLLAFSRRQILEPRIIKMDQLVAGMERLLRRLIGEDIELSTVLSEDVGHVFADPGQLEQVIMNLAVNARDAMPQGGKLTIEVHNVELSADYASRHQEVTPGPYVMLSVTDTGHGMDRETQQHIFEPFFTTKEKGKGTGLGLSTVFGIVKQSRGHIWVYSEPGRGAAFKIYLPRSELPEGATSLPARVTSALLGGTETVLLVEDEEQIRFLVRTILEDHGYRVLEARNGPDALVVSERFEGTIHLLLTDVVMPQMSGRQLAERLTAIKPDIRVLYVSGYTDNTIVHHGILDAGTAFLQKPLTPEPLLRKVREVLDLPASTSDSGAAGKSA